MSLTAPEQLAFQPEIQPDGHEKASVPDHTPTLMEDIRHDGVFSGALHWVKDHIPHHSRKPAEEAAECPENTAAAEKDGSPMRDLRHSPVSKPAEEADLVIDEGARSHGHAHTASDKPGRMDDVRHDSHEVVLAMQDLIEDIRNDGVAAGTLHSFPDHMPEHETKNAEIQPDRHEQVYAADHSPTLMEDIRHDGVFSGALHWVKDHIPHSSSKPAEQAAACHEKTTREVGEVTDHAPTLVEDIRHDGVFSGTLHWVKDHVPHSSSKPAEEVAGCHEKKTRNAEAKSLGTQYLDSVGLLDLSNQSSAASGSYSDSQGVCAALLLHRELDAFRPPSTWLSSLLILDLSSNRLRCPPELSGCRVLHTLLLSNNCLGTIGQGALCPHLVELQAASNLLTGLGGVQRYPNLVRLDLRANKIGALSSLRSLSAWSSLRGLALAGNPVAELPGLQTLLPNLLPQLEVADALPASRHRRLYSRRAQTACSRSAAVAAARDAGLPALRFFDTERYREDVTRLHFDFAYATFLDALTGGLGAHAAPEIRESSCKVASSVYSSGTPCRKTLTWHQVNSDDDSFLTSSRAMPAVDLSGERSPVTSPARSLQSFSRRTSRNKTHLAPRSARRLPKELSSALGEMSCSSLRQHQRELQEQSNIELLDSDSSVNCSKDIDGAFTGSSLPSGVSTVVNDNASMEFLSSAERSCALTGSSLPSGGTPVSNSLATDVDDSHASFLGSSTPMVVNVKPSSFQVGDVVRVKMSSIFFAGHEGRVVGHERPSGHIKQLQYEVKFLDGSLHAFADDHLELAFRFK